MRVEKPEVGKTYWSKSQFRIYATDGSREYPIHAAELIDDGWRVCTMSADNVHLYDADPTKPQPLPLDLSKPVKRRDGLQIRNVRLSDDGKRITYEVVGLENPLTWYGQVVALDGRADARVDHRSDLLQCVCRDWKTPDDVPDECEWIRWMGNAPLRFIGVDSFQIRYGEQRTQWQHLASIEWAAKRSGPWKPCCVWE